MPAAGMPGTLSCLPITLGGDCSLIKAAAKMTEGFWFFFGAAPKLRSGRKTQCREEGWEKGSWHGMSQLTQL